MDNEILEDVQMGMETQRGENEIRPDKHRCLSADCIKKMRGLEYCVEELTDQNQAFVETVLELETEVENRVRGMEELLSRTAESAKAYMVKLNDHEELTTRALRDKSELLKHIRNLKSKCRQLEDEKNNILDQNNNLTHDISSLVKLITHARNTGQWDVGNIEFCDVTFEQVFGSTDRLSHWSDEDKSGTPNSLPDHHSVGYNHVKKNSTDRLSSSTFQPPSYVVGFNCRNGHHINRDTQVIQLQGELNRSRKILVALETDLADRDRTIAELQVQITDLNHEISRREAECFVHVQRMNHVNCHQISSIESIELLDSTKCEELDHFLPSTKVTVCSGCESRLNLIEQLRSDNQILTEECKNHQTSLDKCCSDIEAALITNSKLEQEISVTESLWQELEAIKEENETLLEKLEKTCKKEKEMEKKLRASKKEMAGDYEQLKSELSKLKELEERHRVKANGLEVVVQQLQMELEKRKEEQDLVTEIEELKRSKIEQQEQVEELVTKLESLEKISNSNTKVIELEEKLTDLQKELQVTLSLLQTRNDEIELQKSTILNLQEAVVSLKRSTSSNALATASDRPNATGPTTSSVQKPQIRRYTSSGDVFDI